MFIEKSEFDSSIYKFSIGRLDVNLTPRSRKSLSRLLLKARLDFKLLIFRIQKKDSKLWRIYEDFGASKMDTLTTLVRDFKSAYVKSFKLKDVKIEGKEVLADKKDIKFLQKIGSNAFIKSHLFKDLRLNKKSTERLYRNSLINHLKGRAQYNFVARIRNVPVGFITLLLKKKDLEFKNKKRGTIHLIAVDNNYRGRGIGNLLVSSALEWFSNRCEVVTVGTQVGNFEALLLYKKFGFRKYKVENTYHLWLDKFRINET